MGNTKRLTAKDTRVHQTAFLKILREGELTLAQILRKAGVTRSRLSRWLRGRSFRRRIRPILSRLRELKKLEAVLTGCVAQTKVSRAVQKVNPQTVEPKQLVELSGNRKKPRSKSKPKGCRRTHASVSDTQARALGKLMKQAKSELN
ncbi:MAG TPA: hypothetical protein VHD56_01025 [Tepidisphaeraceae bacterium]|nr:hypothetical protein [Tepidisphaeraceae bacterium]